jgi:hypothetical protein
MRCLKEESILEEYKWANGFTKIKMNKIQQKLGDGCNYGMMYILLGPGLILHIPMGLFLANLLNNSLGLGISFLLFFAIGFLIETYCYIQRDKVTYNKMIERESQLNLFKDFGLK